VSGHGHHIQRLGSDWYRLSWSWDKKYSGCRYTYPKRLSRDTDLAGAERFAKKWGVAMPASPTQGGKR